ncbi:MAG TPA: hypothetical protein VD865_03745 [Stenotrophomonas sp.]|nr:hypothetical protein [Stenotrophomonas sp.]
MNPRARLRLRVPCSRPLEGGKVFRRQALGFRLRCTPAAAPHLAAFTVRALALRGRGDVHA